jgi:hypothetical protein
MSVMGIYPDRTTVSDAVNVLQKSGYRATDISVLSSDNQGSKDFAHVKRSKALEGAAVGGFAGAVVGAALAWFVSLHPQGIAAFGPLVAAGPVLASIAGSGAGGALGWIVGLLIGGGLTEYVARRYEGRIRRGGNLLSVHCDSPEWCARARKTLKDTGALDISSSREYAADYGTADKPTERAPVLVERAPVLIDRAPVIVERAPVPVAERVEVPAPQTVEYVPQEIKK